MLSALVSILSGPGSSPNQGHLCCVFGQINFTLTVPLPTQVCKWVPVCCCKLLSKICKL